MKRILIAIAFFHLVIEVFRHPYLIADFYSLVFLAIAFVFQGDILAVVFCFRTAGRNQAALLRSFRSIETFRTLMGRRCPDEVDTFRQRGLMNCASLREALLKKGGSAT